MINQLILLYYCKVWIRFVRGRGHCAEDVTLISVKVVYRKGLVWVRGLRLPPVDISVLWRMASASAPQFLIKMLHSKWSVSYCQHLTEALSGCKHTRMYFGRGFSSDPAAGAYSTSLDPLQELVGHPAAGKWARKGRT